MRKNNEMAIIIWRKYEEIIIWKYEEDMKKTDEKRKKNIWNERSNR